jgi:integrase/recombinase XerD
MRAPTLNEAEFETALTFADSMTRPAMYRLMLLLSIRLGLRPMEIAGMQSSWFRGDELRIPLGHSKRKEGRSIAINEELLAALYAHMGERTGTVFLSEQGAPFKANGISDAFRRLYKMAGVQGSCYSGRRTLASNLVDRDINILVIQNVLGHASPLTTMKYCSVTPTMMRRALFG